MSVSSSVGRTITTKRVPATWVWKAVPSHVEGREERAPYVNRLTPWYEQRKNPVAALFDYLRVCACVAPWMLERLFGDLVRLHHLREAVTSGILTERKWRGQRAFFLNRQRPEGRADYPNLGWDPVRGPYALRAVMADLLGRRGYQDAQLLLGWDSVEWMYEFLEPKGIPHHWSNEEGVGAGMVYAVDPKGNQEIVVVMPSQARIIEAAFRFLMHDLTEPLAWLVDGAEGGEVGLRVVWLMSASSPRPGHHMLRDARHEFARLWSMPKMIRFRQGDRMLSLDGVRLYETAILVTKDGPVPHRMWELLSPQNSMAIPEPASPPNPRSRPGLHVTPGNGEKLPYGLYLRALGVSDECRVLVAILVGRTWNP